MAARNFRSLVQGAVDATEAEASTINTGTEADGTEAEADQETAHETLTAFGAGRRP